VDFFKATADDLKALKWGRWSKDSPLWLCPEKQFADLPDGIALHSISGKVAVKGRDAIDDDTRFGYLAYGIIPGKTRTSVSAEAVAQKAEENRAQFVDLAASIVRKSGLYTATGKLEGDEAEGFLRATIGK